MALFGFARALWVGVALLAMSGAADMISAAYRSTILQVAAPDNLRGRLQGVFTVVVAGGPRMGDFVAGTTAALLTPTLALAIGGTACIVGVLVACAWQPRLPRVRRADTPSPSVASGGGDWPDESTGACCCSWGWGSPGASRTC